MKSTLKCLLFLIVAGVSVGSGAASAQSLSSDCSGGHCRPHHGGYRVSYGHAVPFYGYGYRPRGYDFRFGVAEIIRATGEANVLNAEARTQHAHAARLEMENSVEVLHTRLERKRINRESRFGHLHRRGELVRAEKAALAAATPPVIRRAVDPATGQVHWPLLLRTSHYAKARGPVDLVFHERSVQGSINPDHFLPMRDWIELIECELKSNVYDYEMTDYLEAKAFLRELIAEARTDLGPAGSQMLAAN